MNIINYPIFIPLLVWTVVGPGDFASTGGPLVTVFLVMKLMFWRPFGGAACFSHGPYHTRAS
jgi:hypothetical protein